MNEIMQKCNDKMNKAVQALDKEYAAIRAGRSNPSILNKGNVDYYGVPTPVQQMASVSVPDPRTIMIQPYDMSTLKEIEKAIQASDIGINPNNDGKVLRLNFPPLTEERRKDLVKEIKKYGEECKVTIRNVRRDILEKFKAEKKDGNITEDDMKNYEKKVQEATDKFCKEIDVLSADKEKEIMSI